MPKNDQPFSVGDIGALAKSLAAQMEAKGKTPSHLELLNMLARAAGFRNYQHFHAGDESIMPQRPVTEASSVDMKKIQKLARHFDAEGNLVRWPGKASERTLCLWVLWSRIPARRVFDEKTISAILDSHHHFGDYALLRREMFGRGMLTRQRDGSRYQRIEQEMPDEALALVRYLACGEEDAALRDSAPAA